MEEKNKPKYGLNEAMLKIEHYCAYQERCQKEVKEKLFSYGLNSSEVNQLLEKLVSRGFLNEERFAKAFAGGKFRQKKWGRNKIVRELKLRQISEYCIKKALKEIDDADYSSTIEKTAAKYAAGLKSGTSFARKQKVIKYLMSRGFEYEQCHDIIKHLFDNED